MTAERLPIVGVMGSGKRAHAARARPLGQWLARAGVHLLTGGGGGVMSAVSRAFCETPDRRGLVLGVLREGARPNAWVEVPIRTHLALSGTEGTSSQSRNHINVLTAAVVVALPGSDGTSSEVRLALRYGRPVIAFVAGADEIPDLAAGVPLAGELDQVQRFVRSHLGRTPTSD